MASVQIVQSRHDAWVMLCNCVCALQVEDRGRWKLGGIQQIMSGTDLTWDLIHFQVPVSAIHEPSEPAVHLFRK